MKKFIVCIVTLAALLIMQLVGVNAALSAYAQRAAIDGATYCAEKIGDKVTQTLDLLISLTENYVFQGTETTYRQKAAMLDIISSRFGYMMIRVLDEDLNVYTATAESEDGKASNLSKRDYLQDLKKTLEPQVTDAFLAGADGKTVNFTVAVAVQKDGVFKGALFAAIYESDFEATLKENKAMLVGKKMQFMSGVSTDEYGMTLDSELENVWLIGSSLEERMLEIKGKDNDAGLFWGMRNALPVAYAYDSVENADWNVLCRVSFADAIGANPLLSVMTALSLAGTLFLLIGVIINRKKFS